MQKKKRSLISRLVELPHDSISLLKSGFFFFFFYVTSTYLNRTPISEELISFAVDSITPPNRPPPLRPGLPPIISADLRIMKIRNPEEQREGQEKKKIDPWGPPLIKPKL